LRGEGGPERSEGPDEGRHLARTVVLRIVLLFAIPAHAIPVDDYVASLERIHTFLAANQLPAAKAEAATLHDARVEWTGGHFQADSSLVGAVANATRADRQLMQRIELTVLELRGSGAAAGPRANPKLLQQVAAEQEVDELAPGGAVNTTVEGEMPLLERIGESIAAMFRWLGDWFVRILEWILDLFPGSRPGEKRAATGMSWIVTGVTIVIAIAIVLLALEVARRSKKRTKTEVATSEPIGSRRDEDPLSRGATEWERYAAQLAAAGRFREAIRAWYHAVLVTCYSAGVLHFRKGRTNWEYVATVPPSVPWRPELIELTRRFELEWYGHDQSTADALDDCSERAQRILESLRHRGAA
jgi:hypothetical protein